MENKKYQKSHYDPFSIQHNPLSPVKPPEHKFGHHINSTTDSANDDRSSQDPDKYLSQTPNFRVINNYKQPFRDQNFKGFKKPHLHHLRNYDDISKFSGPRNRRRSKRRNSSDQRRHEKPLERVLEANPQMEIEKVGAIENQNNVAARRKRNASLYSSKLKSNENLDEEEE